MIFGIGLSRTGTTSLNRALELLGYRSCHYPEPEPMLARRFEEALAGYDAATDITVSECFEELDRAYPGSRFILTMRDLGSWLTSIEYRLRVSGRDPMGPAGDVRERVLGSRTFDRARLIEGYHAHHRRVGRYFRDRPGDLLEFSACEGDGWGQLCPFLGVPIPNIEFPHHNRMRCA